MNSPLARRWAVFLLLLLLGGHRGVAQNYPVVVTPFVKSAYSPQWHDYANNPDLLRINLILRDQTKDEIEVYLYIAIKGLGWSISTNPSFVPAQKIKLQRGTPLTLRGPDIADYLAA
ncbi:MAG: hypothetical protein MUE30_19815, partial [Spirosomaceae bacterium]|nr:hypothetical protein [Spirosomataceae bacterium]